MKASRLCIFLFSLLAFNLQAQKKTFLLSGRIVDSETRKLIPARLYIESVSENGQHTYFHADTSSMQGQAVSYEKSRAKRSVEIHTCLSAHPFKVELPPGNYTLTAIRGKEYLPAIRRITILDKPIAVDLELKRWIRMSEKGWFSGDTHNHRKLENMRTLLLAEDLNVGLPLTAWVSKFEETPRNSSKIEQPMTKGQLIRVDDTHVMWTGNTEYEVGSIGGKRHTFGALFILNHRTPFDLRTLPVRPIAEHARSEGALLELDKHNWPWSMMLMPIAKVDLFELANNHMWRTDFAFSTFNVDYAFGPMEVEKDEEGGFTERGWIDFGFKNYYALLNCGFHISPTAGTASGVHPVPLGFGRVYVQTGEKKLNYEKWIAGLKAGNSFVTTGPMLFAEFNGELPGSELDLENPEKVNILTRVRSLHPVNEMELVINGEVTVIPPAKTLVLPDGTFETYFTAAPEILESSWMALRVFEETPDSRPRFAHTAPVFVNLAGLPLRPRRAEIEYLIKRSTDAVTRNRGVVSAEALAEFEEAADFYKALMPEAR